MKKIWILIVVAICAIIIGLIVFFSFPSATKREKTKESAESIETRLINYIKNINDVAINGGTRKELMNVLQSKQGLSFNEVMTGPYSYLRQLPDDEYIKRKKLDRYIDMGDDLSKRLEKKIQENFTCDIEGVAQGSDYASVLVHYKPYYFSTYVSDIEMISSDLLELAGWDLFNIADKDTGKFIVDKYKARIKAAYLLDSHLDDYYNSDEVITTYVTFQNMKPEDSEDALTSYYLGLTGYSGTMQQKYPTEEASEQFLNSCGVTAENALDL